MVDRRGAYRVLMGETGERDYLEDPGVDGGTFRKWDGGDMDWNGLA